MRVEGAWNPGLAMGSLNGLVKGDDLDDLDILGI